jgi:hypothetical protein
MTPLQAILTVAFWAAFLGPIVWTFGRDAWKGQ